MGPHTLLRVAICQINPTVGDLVGNVACARAALAEAEAADADIAVLPELAVTGYPPEDLVLRPGFVAAGRRALEEIAASTGRCAAAVGFVDGCGGSPRVTPDMAGVGWFADSYNAVALCADGRVHGVYRKRHLPNYDVFDEVRQFRPGDAESPALFDIAGAVVGVTLCEDAWVPGGPLAELAAAGAQVVVNVSSSPFREGKQAAREAVMGRQAADAGVPIVYANLVGGQDDLVFDGGSFVVDAQGSVAARCASFTETVEVFDVELAPPRTAPGGGMSDAAEAVPVTPPRPRSHTSSERLAGPLAPPLNKNAQRWGALVLATADYVRKTRFTDVAVGLSGGVDSSLVAAVAAEALGAEHVHGVLMPSRYSSDHSVADAQKLASNLGIEARIIAIEAAHASLASILEPALGPDGAAGAREAGSIADQNLQARIRGVALMAVANHNGWLVLTTGNKSELAVGYSTLYGDTAGAFAVISDVWKLTVYELCRWLNRRAGRELIPSGVLRKPPSAELAPSQRDDDSLPAYEVLDPILRLYVEEFHTPDEILEVGIAPVAVVERVCHMVDAAEYKRRQSPMGPRLTSRAFGRDRRMPVVNRFR